MPFPYNAKGVKPSSRPDYQVAPEGDYTLVIKTASDEKDKLPRITKNGDPYVSVKCEIEDGEYKGTAVWHNVTFLDPQMKGAGMAIHWLKTIGEPWEGEFEVMPDQWVGRTFKAHLSVGMNNKGQAKNEISYLIDDDTPF